MGFASSDEVNDFIDDVAYGFGLWQFPEQDDVDFAIPKMPGWAPPSKPEYLVEPKMTTDDERWHEAVAAARHYGDEAVSHAADRIMEREEVGDSWGAARWRDIRLRLEALRYAAVLTRRSGCCDNARPQKSSD